MYQKKQKIRTTKEKQLIQKYKEQEIAGENPHIPKKYIKDVQALYTKKEIKQSYIKGNILFMEEHAKNCGALSCTISYKKYLKKLKNENRP